MKTRSLPLRALVLFGIAVLATLVFVVLCENVLEGNLDAPDRRAALAIHHSIDTPILDWIMIGFTIIGSAVGWVSAVAAMTIWLVRNGHRRTALILASNALAAELLVFVLKQFVRRPRPTLFDVITRPETFSFPSGHALSAVAVFGAIAAVLVTLYPRRRTPIVIVAAIVIFCIGFSRVYLGVHWPFDVLAGFAAGVPMLVATVHLLHRKNSLKLSAHDNAVNVYSPP